MNILNIINELSNTPSRNNKKSILAREIKNNLLREVFVAAYNPYINYWQAKIPEYKKDDVSSLDLKTAVDLLDSMVNRKVTGNEAIEYFAIVLSKCNSDDAEVIKRIIQRDLRCGVSEKTINDVWSCAIPGFSVLLAHKDISGIKYPAFAQVKMDGGRCHMHFDGNSATAWSRNGKEIAFHSVFDETAKQLMQAGETWDGEIVFFKNDKALDRKTSNGLFNKGVKGTLSKEEAAHAVFVVWDIVDFSGTIPYELRYENLITRFGSKSFDNIKVVSTSIVNNEDESFAFYNKCIEAGEEGAILKNKNFKWEPKRVKGVGKMKAEEEADLIVVGYQIGTGKYAGMLGALTCETQDGLLRVNVGSGWSDEDRASLTPENTLNKILTVKYNQKIQDKNGSKWRLFLPRAVEFRLDKNVANTLDELK
jgi:ATP-dependent DNA ligase